MYCSSCGVAVAQGLSFCNYCGAQLSAKGDDDKSTELKPGLLVCAMVGLFILGLVAITMLMGMMKAILHLDSVIILAFAGLCFLTLFALEGIFVRLLFARKLGTQTSGDSVGLKGQATKELDAAQAGLLREPMSSVTENTTRTFDPIYNERKSK